MELLLGSLSLEMLTFGIQPPCCEEVQATRRGQARSSRRTLSQHSALTLDVGVS